MTNLEWIKNDDKKLEEFLGLAVNEDTGEMTKCINMPCNSCLFHSSKNDGQPCRISFRKWLNKKHEPLYEDGDIIISKNGNLYLVFKECDGNLKNDLLVANNVESFNFGIGAYISKDKIKRKIGNIHKDTASDIAYEMVGKYIIKEVQND